MPWLKGLGLDPKPLLSEDWQLLLHCIRQHKMMQDRLSNGKSVYCTVF